MQKIQDINKLLEAKDKRSDLVAKLLENNNYVITIRANYPSANKLNAFSDFVVDFFAQKVKLKKIKKVEYDDGLTYLYTSENNPKMELIKLEEKYEIGRLVDLDVYDKNGPVSRKDFNLKPRKCFICENDAKSCARARTHSYEELTNHFNNKVINFMKKEIEQTIYDSLLDELNLETKFGLVTPSTPGIHKDMDYNLMKKSAKTIAKGLSKIVDVMLDDGDIKRLGIDIERQMLDITKGVNTHKGAIFCLGLITYCYLNEKLFKKYNKLAYKSSRIYSDKLLDIKMSVTKDLKTKGETVVDRYRVHGAKDVARDGYRIFDCLSTNDSDHITLLKIIINIDDTTSINRSGLEVYRQFQDKCLELINNWNEEKLIQLDRWACQNRISPGGAADLFAAWKFIKRNNINLGEIKWQLTNKKL